MVPLFSNVLFKILGPFRCIKDLARSFSASDIAPKFPKMWRQSCTKTRTADTCDRTWRREKGDSLRQRQTIFNSTKRHLITLLFQQTDHASTVLWFMFTLDPYLAQGLLEIKVVDFLLKRRKFLRALTIWIKQNYRTHKLRRFSKHFDHLYSTSSEKMTAMFPSGQNDSLAGKWTKDDVRILFGRPRILTWTKWFPVLLVVASG